MASSKAPRLAKRSLMGFAKGTNLSWAQVPPFQRCPLQKEGETVGNPI